MKKAILFFMLITYFGSKLIAQVNTYQPVSDCPNYNAFVKNGLLNELKPFVSEVRQNGTVFLSENSESVEFILNKMGVSPETTFELMKETKSRFDTTNFFRRYRQHYHGVEVIGGGYTTGHKSSTDPQNTSAFVYLLVPHILTGITLNHNPTLPSTNIPSILEVENVAETKLLITHNLTYECEYRLVWIVKYYKDYPKISWIDANTGDIILTIDSRISLDEPTITYDIPTESIKLSPVPATDLLDVAWPPLQADQSVTLQVFDMLGRSLIQERIGINETQRTLNISQLSNGVYYLVLSDKAKPVHRANFIVQH